jgi:hypothetical protein
MFETAGRPAAADIGAVAVDVLPPAPLAAAPAQFAHFSPGDGTVPPPAGAPEFRDGAVVLAELLAGLERLPHLAAALTPPALAGLPGSVAVAALDRLGPVLAALDGARLALLGVVDARGAWALDGSRSPAAWLSRLDRSATAAASVEVRTARALRDRLPATADALLAGRITVGHARVLARLCLRTRTMITALADPDRGEAWLLGQAGLGVDAYQRLVARWCDRVDPHAADDRYREARDSHYLDVAATLDGTHVQGFLEPTIGQALLAALRAETGIPAADDPRSPGRRRHDALATLTSRLLADPAVRTTAQVRPQVVVHVDLDTVTARPNPVSGALPRVAPATLQDSGAPLAPAQLGRVLCDAEVTRVVFGPASEVLDVGRAQRTFTNGRRRALDARDGGCRAPGCHQPVHQCEGHHIIGWQHGGPTSVTNGVLLCWSCHDWLHRTRTRITPLDDGGLRFDTPGGPFNRVTYPRRRTQLTLA